MATDRVLDNRGMEIHVRKEHQHLWYCNISINTAHIWRLSNVTPFVRRRVHQNWFRMSKVIFFISNISNHQGTHLQKPATYKSTHFNMIHNFNWPRKNHATTAEWSMQRKAMRTLWNESKNKLWKLLRQWRIDDKKYIISWQRFLSRDLHTQSTIENMKYVTNTKNTKPWTQVHWITNRNKVKIATPLLPSSPQNKPHKQHIHTFTDMSYQNGIPSRSIRTSSELSKIRRHIW